MASDRTNGPVDLDEAAHISPAPQAPVDAPKHPSVGTLPKTDEESLKKMAETERLTIQAMVHEAWMREMSRKRGFTFTISAQDQGILEFILDAMRKIPDKDVAR